MQSGASEGRWFANDSKPGISREIVCSKPLLFQMTKDTCDSLKMGSDDPAAMDMLALMNVTSDVTLLSSFAEDDRDKSFDGNDINKRMEPSVESPRGLAAWANVFEDEGTSKELSLLLPEPQEWTSTISSHPGSPLLAPPHSQSVELDQTTASPSQKKGGGILRAKRDKARAETLPRMLGVDLEPVVLPTSCAATVPKVAARAPSPRSRSTDRKIRNRASVQRCRAKKLARFETMEKERQTLRKENEALSAALDAVSEIVQTEVADSRKEVKPRDV